MRGKRLVNEGLAAEVENQISAQWRLRLRGVLMADGFLSLLTEVGTRGRSLKEAVNNMADTDWI